MIQTAREHAQGSKQQTRARPASAAPQVSKPGVERLVSHKDATPEPVDQVSVAEVVNAANMVAVLYAHRGCQARA